MVANEFDANSVPDAIEKIIEMTAALIFMFDDYFLSLQADSRLGTKGWPRMHFEERICDQFFGRYISSLALRARYTTAKIGSSHWLTLEN
jgi:hypothetical protein